MMASNLPPGVNEGDPHFYDEDEPNCTCGHSYDEHDADGGRCLHPDCYLECEGYDPDPDPAEPAEAPHHYD
jgi:hypothetical protein